MTLLRLNPHTTKPTTPNQTQSPDVAVSSSEMTPAVRTELLISPATRFRCENRGDLARNRVALHLGDGQLGEVNLLLDLQTLGELYIELRRFLGELGGAGPSRHEVRRAIDTLKHGSTANPTPKLPTTPARDVA